MSTPTDRVDLVVRDCAYVVAGRAPFEVHTDTSIVIDDGRIVGLVPAGAPLPVARRTIDGRHRAVVAGFANAHTHTAFNHHRGAEPELDLDAWLVHVFAESATIDPEWAGAAALDGYRELLRAGFTSAVDHHYAQAHGDNAIAVARAAAVSGVRAAIAPTASDLGDGAVGIDEGIRRLEAVREVALGEGAVTPWVALASPGRRESAERCRVLLEWARAHGSRMTFHYAETTAWFALAEQWGARRMVDVLVDLGLLGPDIVVAHGVWFGPDDFDVLADTGTWISYNPVANGYMGDGITPVIAMREAGVNVCLGTDTVQCCGRADPFEMMKVGALLQKAVSTDARALVARDVLAMATELGHRAIGNVGVGVIEPGAVADLVLVDIDQPRLQPVHDIVWTLVYAATVADVRTVIVGGEPRVIDGLVVA
jgi:5-methylthioadenosine/S-adenosylhomocysteine deaminase